MHPRATWVAVLAVAAAACTGGSVDAPVDQGAATEEAAATAEATVEEAAATEAAAADEEVLDAPPGPAAVVGQPQFEAAGFNPLVAAVADPLSTFAIDVDTGSYTVHRNLLAQGVLPDPAGVRPEEFVNFFPQGYAPPAEGVFAVHADGTASPYVGAGNVLVRVGLQTAQPGPRPPAVLTFVVDTSGSMADEGKLDLVRDALSYLVTQLSPGDRVAIVTFRDSATVALPPTPVEEAGTILQAIAGLQAGGSTNVEAGLQLGYGLAQEVRREGTINRVVLASDGIANTGLTDPDGLAAQLRTGADAGIQLVTVGVGLAGYHDALMEQLADQGDGFYAYVDGPDEARRVFGRDVASTLQTVALDARVQVEWNAAAVAAYRLIGFENRDLADHDFANDAVDAGEVGAGHSVTALYEVVPVDGLDGVLATVRVRWLDPVSRAAAELSQPVLGSDVVADLSRADPHLQLDAVVAAYADRLRGNPAATYPLTDVATDAARVAALLPAVPDAAELAGLIRVAASLAG